MDIYTLLSIAIVYLLGICVIYIVSVRVFGLNKDSITHDGYFGLMIFFWWIAVPVLVIMFICPKVGKLLTHLRKNLDGIAEKI